jgi:hypothetical protein
MPHEEGLPMSPYETNRAKIPLEELMKHDGRWVAIRKDGSQILDSADSLLDLEDRLIAAGIDPQDAAYERINFEQDSYLGGVEFQ